MKASILILFFVLSIACYPSASGQLHNFFEHVHDTFHKAGEDVRIFFKLDRRQDKASDTKSTETAQVVATSQSTETPKITTVAPITTTKAFDKVETTTKEGRENFAGGCATGFMRTADGRCKPTFG
uniref:Precursor of insect cytokine ENF peptide n=2 Tax=Neogurelca himachala sangaica TaxID=656750 RepID=E1CEG5_9NEOP|nr:precursor of insect cytokine ENF peptide [Neogurelca himachala sangaica]